MIGVNRNIWFGYGYDKRSYAGAFLLLLFLLLQANNILFQHRHVLSNGTVIVHAHPFAKNADGTPKKHTHSNGEFLTLSAIFHAVFFGTDGISYQDLPRLYQTFLLHKLHLGYYESASDTGLRLRGPPGEHQ